ncbi:MAG: hypothetical protein EOR26_05145 [Mesorhizobium sp.]|uniref:hypothetical protein n=1 Tax=unclassified Mesorhizobium TaxID=325217 RepID=UPI000FCC9C0E|nr:MULTISPECIES: hypothetical protein [unclassified Mesorhizobium]RUV69664.1 hypothetical protein EOA78_22760 [Mesorhizobium sp. M5C.F.Cr.IN.023.01.1.1]RWI51084.1 MAG: hypothetical protein EOR15_06725 [Mesorhizobium sp.]RWI62072.1 MAG: hypothetical protein EOR16_03925 [Mesorhizobium sp.]RWJ13922.1 MAG: hypothetical protein EOR24_01180 [Mesorhizobium sp.]RWJ16852.1 MAG: hypothetical protein EOR25_13260 [Mesorhizobium sp.]
MTPKDEIDNLAATMSEEEMRARSEAATIGHLNVLDTVLAALITQSPNPDAIRAMIAQLLENLKAAKEEHPSLAWVPGAILAGASPTAEYLLRACSEAGKSN